MSSLTLDVRIFRILRMSVVNSTHTSYTLDVKIFRILRMSVNNSTHTSYTLDVRIFRISRISVINSTHTAYTLDVRIFRILRMSVINSTHPSYTECFRKSGPFCFCTLFKKIIEPKISYVILWEKFFHFERDICVQVKLFPNYYIFSFQNNRLSVSVWYSRYRYRLELIGKR